MRLHVCKRGHLGSDNVVLVVPSWSLDASVDILATDDHADKVTCACIPGVEREIKITCHRDDCAFRALQWTDVVHCDYVATRLLLAAWGRRGRLLLLLRAHVQ